MALFNYLHTHTPCEFTNRSDPGLGGNYVSARTDLKERLYEFLAVGKGKPE